MNKKGLIGKIILIVVLVIVLIIGITIWQVYDVYKTATTEQAKMQAAGEEMNQYAQDKNITGTCQKSSELESSMKRIKDKIKSACLNPIISFGINKMMADKPIQTPAGNIVISCSNLEEVYNNMAAQMQPLKDLCSNQTLMNQIENSSANSTA